MAEVPKQIAELIAKNPDENIRLQCEIEHLVYELYGLTDDQIKIVEEATE